MRLCLLAFVAFFCTGCLYRITDLDSNKTYIARWNSIHTYGRGGSVQFIDTKTGDDVSVNRWQIHELTSDEAKQEESTK